MPKNVSLFVLSAEDILLKSLPEIYDKDITSAYASSLGRRREAYELKGVNDLSNGTYDFRGRNRWFKQP